MRDLPAEPSSAEIKAAMEKVWRDGQIWNIHKKARWILPGGTGGWVLPGLEKKNADDT